MSAYRRILWLALPIMGGMLSQNLLDLVDTAMVGTLGPVSLAAVGLGAFTNFMMTALILGVGSGVQTLVARHRGAERLNELAIPLNAGLIVVAAVAIPLSAVLMRYSSDIFAMLNDDPAVVEEGSRYLNIRLVAMVAVGANFCFRGYLNGIERTTVYLGVIVVVHLLNIVISWVLIFGKLGFPALGSLGAGIGTSLSLAIGTVIYFVIVHRLAASQGFLKKFCNLFEFKKLLEISIPSSLQSLFFAAGLVALFWIIGHIDVNAVATSNVIVNLLKVGILPGVALGLAAMTLVSESVGRNQPAEAKRWAWQVVIVASIVMGLIVLPGVFMPTQILRAFLHEPELVAQAVTPLQIAAIAVLADSVGIILLNSLIGAGAARTAMLISIVTQWVIGLPLCYLAATYFEPGLAGVWAGQGLYRIVQALVLVYIWRQHRFTAAT